MCSSFIFTFKKSQNYFVRQYITTGTFKYEISQCIQFQEYTQTCTEANQCAGDLVCNSLAASGQTRNIFKTFYF